MSCVNLHVRSNLKKHTYSMVSESSTANTALIRHILLEIIKKVLSKKNTHKFYNATFVQKSKPHTLKIFWSTALGYTRRPISNARINEQ